PATVSRQASSSSQHGQRLGRTTPLGEQCGTREPHFLRLKACQAFQPPPAREGLKEITRNSHPIWRNLPPEIELTIGRNLQDSSKVGHGHLVAPARRDDIPTG